MNYKYLNNILLMHTTGLMILFIIGLMHCRWCCTSCFQGTDHLQKPRHTATLRHRKKSHNFYSTEVPTGWWYWPNSHFSYHYYNEAHYVPSDSVENLCMGKMGQVINYFYCLIPILMWTMNSKHNSFHCYSK
jgi:hypothetical protein